MSYRCTFLDTICAIPAATWDALMAQNASTSAPGYPFATHAFLRNLEQSGSATATTGWQPQHMLIYEETSRPSHQPQSPIGLLPLYVKYHSMGEYVFDWQWAEAYARYGLDYYPKLLTAIPFTPSQGPRLGCVKEHQNNPLLYESITNAIQEQAKRLGCTSWHLLFTPPHERQLWAETHLCQRQGVQFHWHNRNYRNFDDFLSTLTSRKRKTIKQERRRISDAGFTFQKHRGRDITEAQWHVFYQFYASTYLLRRQKPYLTLEFFLNLSETLPENVFLLFATLENKIVAGALFFQDQTALYGRYWGSLADFHSLHFETCYYQGIDYAIEKGLERFDAGAQGEHKLKRGFSPQKTDSWHWLENPTFDAAVRQAVAHEQQSIDQYFEAALKAEPYKKGP